VLQFVAVSDDYSLKSTDDLLMAARLLKSVRTGVQKTGLPMSAKSKFYHFPDTTKMVKIEVRQSLRQSVRQSCQKRNVYS